MEQPPPPPSPAMIGGLRKKANDNTAQMLLQAQGKRTRRMESLEATESLMGLYENKVGKDNLDIMPEHEKTGKFNLSAGKFNSGRTMDLSDFEIVLSPDDIENSEESKYLAFKNLVWKTNPTTSNKILFQADLYRGDNGIRTEDDVLRVFVKIEPYDVESEVEHPDSEVEITKFVFEKFCGKVVSANTMQAYHYLVVKVAKIPSELAGKPYKARRNLVEGGNEYAKIKIFEMIEGESLERSITTKLPPGSSFLDPKLEYATIVFQLLYALACLEKLKVLHLDIKLENIMVTDIINERCARNVETGGFMAWYQPSWQFRRLAMKNAAVIFNEGAFIYRQHEKSLKKRNLPNNVEKTLLATSVVAPTYAWTDDVGDEHLLTTRTSGKHKMPVIIDYGLSEILQGDKTWFDDIAYTLFNRPPEFFFYRADAFLDLVDWETVFGKGNALIPVKDDDLENLVYKPDTGSMLLDYNSDRFAMGLVVLDLVQNKLLYNQTEEESKNIAKGIKESTNMMNYIMRSEIEDSENRIPFLSDPYNKVLDTILSSVTNIIKKIASVAPQVMNAGQERSMRAIFYDGVERTLMYLWSMCLVLGIPEPNSKVRKTLLYQLLIKPYEKIIASSPRYNLVFKSDNMPVYERQVLKDLLAWDSNSRKSPVNIMKERKDDFFAILKPFDAKYRFQMSLNNLEEKKEERMQEEAKEKEISKRKRQEGGGRGETKPEEEEKKRKIQLDVSHNLSDLASIIQSESSDVLSISSVIRLHEEHGESCLSKALEEEVPFVNKKFK